jgi:hypothetical protein
VRAPLRYPQLTAVLDTLSNGTLGEFTAHSSQLHASFIVSDSSAASVGAGALPTINFHADSLSSPLHVKPLLIALAGAVSRGMRLISDLLDSSRDSNSSRSSNEGAGGSSDSCALLNQLPAVLGIRCCCIACSALVGQHWELSACDRRAAVDIAVLAGTSGECTGAGPQALRQ